MEEKMDKNDREKNMLYQWAESNGSDNSFQKIDKAAESYFDKRTDVANDDRYIREYSIESLPELMKEIDTLWGTDEVMGQIKKAVGVAALKNKPVKPDSGEKTKAENKPESKDKLPAFIYNF